jgi:hypothetical protein
MIFIISAELSTKTIKENINRTKTLAAALTVNKLNYVKAKGMYKGIKENSFIVSSDNDYQVKLLSRLFNQESILIKDSSGISLHYTNGLIERIGTRLIEVSKQVIKTVEAYTKIGSKYLIVK